MELLESDGRRRSCSRGKELKVVVSDLNVAGSEETVQEIESAGGDAMAIAGDVSDTVDARRMVESTVEAYGRVDVVLNSAGVISDTVNPWGRCTRRSLRTYGRVVRPCTGGQSSRHLPDLLAGDTADATRVAAGR